MSDFFATTTAEQQARFAAILQEHNASTCSNCAAPITFAGCYAGVGQTESGTEFSDISVACPACGTDVFVGSSWNAGLDDVDDFLDILEIEWE